MTKDNTGVDETVPGVKIGEESKEVVRKGDIHVQDEGGGTGQGPIDGGVG